jgi:hypothetical protein
VASAYARLLRPDCNSQESSSRRSLFDDDWRNQAVTLTESRTFGQGSKSAIAIFQRLGIIGEVWPLFEYCCHKIAINFSLLHEG